MVRIFKPGYNVFNLYTVNVIRDDESVDDNSEVAFFIRDVAITAGGGDYSALIERATGKSVRNQFLREWLCPSVLKSIHSSVESLSRVTCKVVVKITSADYIIAILILCFHIVHKHGYLRCANLIVATVCRRVNVEYNELLSILHVYTAYAVTTVKVEKFRHGCGYRQTSAQGGLNVK